MEETQWVVMVDKNPVGPFDESAIREKLDAGEFRPNDIAFKVPQGETKPGSEWKFLWQFSEFDRRAPENFASIDGDRRQEKNTDDVRRQVLSELPKEFQNLPSLVAGELPNEPSMMGVAQKTTDNPALEGKLRINFRPAASWAIVAAVAVGVGFGTWKLMGMLAKPFMVEHSRIPATEKK